MLHTEHFSKLAKNKRGKRMADKIIIPMKVLAYNVFEGPKTGVPELNLNYETAASYNLGKDVQLQETKLRKGVHLHFILPSAFKHGVEKIDKDGNKTLDYPLVPNRFIVTRMYVYNGNIVHDCNIVESDYITPNYDKNIDRITIPYWEDNDNPYRYLGRQYSGFNDPTQPQSKNNEEYINDLTAIGPGDPAFNAYYPSCRSVFGYYDDLKGVPKDVILTYSVVGYYSDAQNDPFSSVKTQEDMEQILTELSLSIEKESICNSCLLFGEVCHLDPYAPQPPSAEINAGVGKSSAEALSAVIYQKYAKDCNSISERDLTTIQYDMTSEDSQIDGNFRIDDTIHSYGYSALDPMETQYGITFSKDVTFDNPKDVLSKYSELSKEKSNIGKLRRELEFKKNTLYYLWEIYIEQKQNESPLADSISEKIKKVIKEIEELRNKITTGKQNLEDTLTSLKGDIDLDKVKIDETSVKPFYVPKDPALMLFGNGISRTHTFGEDGDLQRNNTLLCLTSPLSSDNQKVIDYISSLSQKDFISEITKDKDGYLKAVTMTLLLDKDLVNSAFGETIEINIDKHSFDVMVNTEPNKPVILFMEWETKFYNDYENSSAKLSSFEHGDTDYKYNFGEKGKDYQWCKGTSILTPHGVYNFEDKLKKYTNKLEEYYKSHQDRQDIKELIDDLNNIAKDTKNIPAISQNLGGFTIDLASLKYVFQMPIDIVDDELTKPVQDCLYNKNSAYYEPDPERHAVIDGADANLVPLREGFLDFINLSVVSTFGIRKPVVINGEFIDGKIFFSENIYSKELCPKTKYKSCFLPLALTTPARLSAHFISALDKNISSCSLPGSSPIIAIIMPDLLNRNLNIYDNAGDLIGIIKTVYRVIDGQKTPVGRFVQASNAPEYDSRIDDFKNVLINPDNCSKGRSYLSELMDVIDKKLENTIPMDQSDFIFGRVLVLTEMNIELEYYGGTEFSKNPKQVEQLDDKGLWKEPYPVMIGDIDRVTDGVICGFYGSNGEFENGFAAFGYETKNNKYLNATHPKVSGETAATVTLLLDPMQKVTLSTGILPVEQIQIDANHTDFSNMNLMATEMNTLISETNQIQLPDFTRGEKFTREYPILENGITNKALLNVVNAEPKIGTIGKTIITDGFIVKDE